VLGEADGERAAGPGGRQARPTVSPRRAARTPCCGLLWAGLRARGWHWTRRCGSPSHEGRRLTAISQWPVIRRTHLPLRGQRRLHCSGAAGPDFPFNPPGGASPPGGTHIRAADR